MRPSPSGMPRDWPCAAADATAPLCPPPPRIVDHTRQRTGREPSEKGTMKRSSRRSIGRAFDSILAAPTHLPASSAEFSSLEPRVHLTGADVDLHDDHHETEPH